MVGGLARRRTVEAGGGGLLKASFGLSDGRLRVRLVGSSNALPEVSQVTRRWGMGAGDLPLLLRALGLARADLEGGLVG